MYIKQPYFEHFLYHKIIAFTGNVNGKWIECQTTEHITWAAKDMIVEDIP